MGSGNQNQDIAKEAFLVRRFSMAYSGIVGLAEATELLSPD